MFDRLPYPPADYHICPCCSTEFGSDDAQFSHAQLREMWLAGGAAWFFGRPPHGWNPWLQLIRAGGLGAYLPQFGVGLRAKTASTIESLKTNYSADHYQLTAA
jgi:hypothetical protein